MGSNLCFTCASKISVNDPLSPHIFCYEFHPLQQHDKIYESAIYTLLNIITNIFKHLSMIKQYEMSAN